MPQKILEETTYKIEKIEEELDTAYSLAFAIYAAVSTGVFPSDDYTGAAYLLTNMLNEIYEKTYVLCEDLYSVLRNEKKKKENPCQKIIASKGIPK